MKKTRIRASVYGLSTSKNCGLGISSWSSWLELVTGAMSRGARDPELGGDFIFQLPADDQKLTEAPAANKSLLLY
jgi:hypothetical protein